jgi:hypothetical protein
MRRQTYLPSAALVALAAAIVATPASVSAQKPEDAVIAVVHRMFEGMRTADSGMVRPSSPAALASPWSMPGSHHR